MNQGYTVVDLFCGCGGLSKGFSSAGYNVLLGIDHWEDALCTYSKNHPDTKILLEDLSELMPDSPKVGLQIGDVDVIIGGPPCQGFSVAGKHIIDDERNKLYKSFVRFVANYQPKAFVMENVPQILTIGNGAIKQEILKDFESLGYIVAIKVLCAADYGVPQNRRRAFFVGLKNETFQFPRKTQKNHITVSEAISDLPEESVEDGDAYSALPLSDYQRLMRLNSKGIYNHSATVHTVKTKKIIAMVPDGGNYLDLPKHLHNTRKVNIAWTRMNSQKPCFTIDTGHNHHFHYKYNRVPTARESARIQSFPDNFVFYSGKTSQLKQIGNAVPPLLAEAVARQLLTYLNNEIRSK